MTVNQSPSNDEVRLRKSLRAHYVGIFFVWLNWKGVLFHLEEGGGASVLKWGVLTVKGAVPVSVDVIWWMKTNICLKTR